MFANIQTRIRQACLLSLIGLVTAGVSTAWAGEFKHVAGNWNITNNSNQPADDFHVTVVHPGGASVQAGNPNQFYNDGFFQPRTATPSGGGQGTDLTLKLDWFHEGPGTINLGQTIHVGFEYESTNYQPTITDAYWTHTEGGIHIRNTGEQPKLAGFTVGSLKLSNNTGEEMTVENLNFFISPVQVPLAAMLPYVLPGFGTSSGVGTFVPTFTIPDGGAVDVTSFLPALPAGNEFLLWQLTTYSTDTPTFISEGMYQFEGSLFPVPEPGTMLLLGGILAIGRLVRRKRLSCPKD